MTASTTSPAPPRPLRDRTRSVVRRIARPVRSRVHWTLLHGLVRVGIDRAAKRRDPHALFMVATRPGGDVEASTAALRAAAGPHGMAHGLLGHATVDHAGCREVLTSPDFSSGVLVGDSARLNRWIDATHGPHLDPIRSPSLLMIEPPDHTRIRKLTTRYFTGRAVATLADTTREIATGLLDELERGAQSGVTRVDLVTAYCSKLPVAVISQILGVPDSAADQVLELGTRVAASLDIGASWQDTQATVAGLEDFHVFITAHLDHLRRNPGDNLLSQLVRARDEDGQLSEDELAIAAGLILAAGFETTVNLLSNGIRLLLDHPDQRDLLLADPTGWANACEEVLRFDPPVLLSGRHTVRDTVVAGEQMRAHTMVTAVLYGANRDPKVFENPHLFDVTRANAAQHLSFSAGRHHCLGAALARMEGTQGLQLFFERFPRATALPGASRRHTRILRGWESLPVQLT